jgi:predicted O-methyltransferase YrrM
VSWFSCVAELPAFPYLSRAVVELNGIEELKRVFGWSQDPTVDDPELTEYRRLEDVNQRRLRDVQTLGTIVANSMPSVCVDIGTGVGYSAAVMAINHPGAEIWTVNVPPEEYGEAGTLTTVKLAREEIGRYWRGRQIASIKQVYANTALWEPETDHIDVAFIDGCHDTEFVINDTIKVLRHMRPGAFLLWHDFSPSLAPKLGWIASVHRALETLFRRRILSGRVLHVRDSWIGVHRVS